MDQLLEHYITPVNVSLYVFG